MADYAYGSNPPYDCRAPDLGHRTTAIPDLDAAVRALRLNRRK